MRAKRTLHLAVAMGWLVWSSAIVPGHSRGCVPLSAIGLHATTATISHCCSAAKTGEKSDGKRSDKRSSGDCAICYLAVQLKAPTAPPPPRLDFFALRAIVEIPPLISHESQPTLGYLSRGPPSEI